MDLGIFLLIRKENLWFSLTIYFRIVLLPWLLLSCLKPPKMRNIRKLQWILLIVLKKDRIIQKESGVREQEEGN